MEGSFRLTHVVLFIVQTQRVSSVTDIVSLIRASHVLKKIILDNIQLIKAPYKSYGRLILSYGHELLQVGHRIQFIPKSFKYFPKLTSFSHIFFDRDYRSLVHKLEEINFKHKFSPYMNIKLFNSCSKYGIVIQNSSLAIIGHFDTLFSGLDDSFGNLSNDGAKYIGLIRRILTLIPNPSDIKLYLNDPRLFKLVKECGFFDESQFRVPVSAMKKSVYNILRKDGSSIVSVSNEQLSDSSITSLLWGSLHVSILNLELHNIPESDISLDTYLANKNTYRI